MNPVTDALTLPVWLTMLVGAAVCLAVFLAVARDEARREQVDDELWVRSIDDYKARAGERAASTRRPDPAPYLGAVRKPLSLYRS